LPSVYDLKPRFQALLRPALRPLARAGVTANGVTLAALAGSVAVGLAIGVGREQPRWLLGLPAWLLLRMALNAIDGMMARELDMRSDLGAVLNELGDVLSDVALYLPLAVVAPAARWPAVAFAVGAVVSEFSGVLTRALGASRRYDGPMGKSDRAFWIGLLALIGGLAPGTLAAWPAILSLGAALAAWTTLRRLQLGLRELRTGARP